MSEAPETVTGTEIFAKPETLLRVPMGFASPLWGLFAGAAITGSAWWWMTRFARPANLEAMFATAEAKVEGAVATLPTSAAVEASVEPVLDAVAEAPVQMLTAAEKTMETVVEPAAEQVAEALAAAPAETLEATEEAVETVAEPTVEAITAAFVAPVEAAEAAAPVVETLLDAAPMDAEPVGGESAPISPLVEALVEAPASVEPAKPRRKAAAPKAD